MMKIQAKIFIGVSIDPDDYPIPSDGNIAEELEDAVKEYFHEIDGIRIQMVKITQQERIENE